MDRNGEAKKQPSQRAEDGGDSNRPAMVMGRPVKFSVVPLCLFLSRPESTGCREGQPDHQGGGQYTALPSGPTMV